MTVMKIPHEQFALAARCALPLVGREATSNPGWHNVLFAGDRARVTDGVVGVDLPLVGLDGAAVSVDRLFLPLDSWAEDVTLVGGGQEVEVRAGGFRATLPTVAGELLPTWPAAPPKKVWGDAPWFPAVLDVLFAAPTKGQNLPLQGVAVRENQAVAGDGVRVARAVAQGAPAGFFPARLVQYLQRVGMADTVQATAVTEDRLWVQCEGGVLVWGLLPAEPWPALLLQSIADFSKTAGKRSLVTWEPTAVAAAVGRVARFALGRLTVEGMKKGCLEFSAESGGGKAMERVPAEVAVPFRVQGSSELLGDAFGRAPAGVVLVEQGAMLFRRPNFELLVMLMVE